MQQIKNNNVKKIGQRIKELRKELNLSINAMAMKYGGISVATWSRIEKGEYNDVDFSTLIAISKAFEVTVDELLKDIDFNYTIIEE
ncbi:helix-turn-helix transcriptional regulator [bacterium]|nr:helix-turn-helix transcriptional regulator [bacterium]